MSTSSNGENSYTQAMQQYSTYTEPNTEGAVIAHFFLTNTHTHTFTLFLFQCVRLLFAHMRIDVLFFAQLQRQHFKYGSNSEWAKVITNRISLTHTTVLLLYICMFIYIQMDARSRSHTYWCSLHLCMRELLLLVRANHQSK